MTRTLNLAVHTVRRQAFVDTAQRLIQSKGYEAMSIQDVLDTLHASRGALYHYFDSKEQLLEAVIDRFVDGAVAVINPIMADGALPAPQKLQRVFRAVADFKGERKELTLRIIEVWTSDANAIVREKLRRMSLSVLVPLLSRIIAQGIEEGVFAARHAEQTATVLASLMLSFQDRAVELFVARQAGRVSFEYVQHMVDAWTRAYERVLGAVEGSLTLTDERTLQFWFG